MLSRKPGRISCAVSIDSDRAASTWAVPEETTSQG